MKLGLTPFKIDSTTPSQWDKSPTNKSTNTSEDTWEEETYEKPKGVRDDDNDDDEKAIGSSASSWGSELGNGKKEKKVANLAQEEAALANLASKEALKKDEEIQAECKAALKREKRIRDQEEVSTLMDTIAKHGEKILTKHRELSRKLRRSACP